MGGMNVAEKPSRAGGGCAAQDVPVAGYQKGDEKGMPTK